MDKYMKSFLKFFIQELLYTQDRPWAKVHESFLR